MAKTCKDCPCWSPDVGEAGACRAEPPTIQVYDGAGGRVISAWPPAHKDAWCYFGRKLMSKWFK